jgi:hypothetical protein
MLGDFQNFNQAIDYLKNLLADQGRKNALDNKLVEATFTQLLEIQDLDREILKNKFKNILHIIPPFINPDNQKQYDAQRFRDEVLNVILELRSRLVPEEPKYFKERYQFQRMTFEVLVRAYCLAESDDDNQGLENWLLWIVRIEEKIKPIFSKYNVPVDNMSELLNQVLKGHLKPSLESAGSRLRYELNKTQQQLSSKIGLIKQLENEMQELQQENNRKEKNKSKLESRCHFLQNRLDAEYSKAQAKDKLHQYQRQVFRKEINTLESERSQMQTKDKQHQQEVQTYQKQCQSYLKEINELEGALTQALENSLSSSAGRSRRSVFGIFSQLLSPSAATHHDSNPETITAGAGMSS